MELDETRVYRLRKGMPRIATFLVLTLLINPLRADWPQWRGPDRSAHVQQRGDHLKSLPATAKVIWKRKAAEGLASPVIAGDKVFHFEAANGKEVLRALKADNGEEVWSQEIDDTFKDGQGPAGPRCTPLVDGDHVYAVSCRGELQCRKTGNGALVWRTSYTQDFGATFIGEKGNAPGASRHGNNGSPLIVGDRLYAFVGSTNNAGVVCFRKTDGKVLWRSQQEQAAYAPPIVQQVAGTDQLLCFMADGLLGLNPGDGALLWKVPVKTASARHVTIPVVIEDVVVISSHQVGMIGTKITKNGNAFSVEQAWLSKQAAMNFASPVVVGKHLYGLGPEKNLICVEGPSGNLKWSQTGYFSSSADKAHAAFIVMGENILCLTDGGELLLFAANPEQFTERGRVQVCGVNWCNPAYADGRLYVRDGIKTTGELLCLDLK
ncbi:MAG: PQQ-binding-like beta-propeller repeat protein [Verrucomicrobiota bacterium]|nr:PQQ-binding-like beta-propeller repeat protein [Verrucomicrobiota bacterium]